MKFSRQLHDVALATGLSSWLARRQPARRIIMLHGIDDSHMPAGALERALGWLARRFDFVALPAMIDAHLAGRAPGRRGELALTFDDGLHNQLSAGYPVLKRLGVPATFFVCPDLIEQRRWIWNQEARSRLQTMSPQSRQQFARTAGAASAEIEPMIQRMKGLPIAARQREEALLRQATPDFSPTAESHERYDPLSWNDLSQLDPALVTIGSHTLSHPILPSIDDAQLEHELAGSRRVLEERLGRTVDLFCYPNGAQDARVHAAVSRCYRAAVTTEYGLVQPGADAHGLRRIPVTPRLPLMAWRMHRPTA